MNRYVRLAGVLCVVLPLSLMAAGSDSSSSAPENPDWLAAQERIDSGEFERAIAPLLRIVRRDPEDADAYNMLGFTHRKTGQLEAALKYYEKALRIDPKHRGAHEYLGQAYLEMGDLPAARKHLAALKKACFFGCREYDKLEESVAKYESRR